MERQVPVRFLLAQEKKDKRATFRHGLMAASLFFVMSFGFCALSQLLLGKPIAGMILGAIGSLVLIGVFLGNPPPEHEPVGGYIDFSDTELRVELPDGTLQYFAFSDLKRLSWKPGVTGSEGAPRYTVHLDLLLKNGSEFSFECSEKATQKSIPPLSTLTDDLIHYIKMQNARRWRESRQL